MTTENLSVKFGEVGFDIGSLLLDQILPIFSRLFVGFIVSIEFILLFYFEATSKIFNSFSSLLNINISIISIVISLLLFLIIGQIFVVANYVGTSILIGLYNKFNKNNDHKRLTKVFEFLINNIYSYNPLTKYDKTFKPLYKSKLIQTFVEYFEIPFSNTSESNGIGNEVFRLSHHYILKHFKHFNIRKIEFDDGLSRGLITNFLILTFIFIWKFQFFLALVSFILAYIFINYLRNLLGGFYVAVCDLAYMEIVLAKKETDPKK